MQKCNSEKPFVKKWIVGGQGVRVCNRTFSALNTQSSGERKENGDILNFAARGG